MIDFLLRCIHWHLRTIVLYLKKFAWKILRSLEVDKMFLRILYNQRWCHIVYTVHTVYTVVWINSYRTTNYCSWWEKRIKRGCKALKNLSKYAFFSELKVSCFVPVLDNLRLKYVLSTGLCGLWKHFVMFHLKWNINISWLKSIY